MDDFWDPREPVPSRDFQELLIEYSHVPKEMVIEHIKTIRSKAWNVRKYPCIGSYMFLDLSMRQHSSYAVVLEALVSMKDTRLLDLGCCIGQDLRKLASDGVPGEQLTGFDIEPGFFSVGYDAFRDESRLRTSFIAGDFLSDQTLEGRYDFIHASDFFHLWSWSKQVQAYTKAVLMLRDRPGCMLFGRNTGVEKARLLDEGPFALMAENQDFTWLHDTESMRRMVEEVSRKTGRELDLRIDMRPIADEQTLSIKAVADLEWNQRLTFTISIK